MNYCRPCRTESTPGAGRPTEVADDKRQSRKAAIDADSAEVSDEAGLTAANPSSRVKFEIFGEEMIEKRVKASGNSGRVYLPPDWVGHKVKIIRID